jgi:lariat debranching enzyme
MWAFSMSVVIAVSGCVHGKIDQAYDILWTIEQKSHIHTDLFICTGDFEALRTLSDLDCMKVPDKYKHMGSFQDYYLGKKIAPYLTLVIGGNHEASNHLWELFYGGWLAPNIYYLGTAGSVYYRGLRICGVSGICKSYEVYSLDFLYC